MSLAFGGAGRPSLPVLVESMEMATPQNWTLAEERPLALPPASGRFSVRDEMRIGAGASASPRTRSKPDGRGEMDGKDANALLAGCWASETNSACGSGVDVGEVAGVDVPDVEDESVGATEDVPVRLDIADADADSGEKDGDDDGEAPGVLLGDPKPVELPECVAPG